MRRRRIYKMSDEQRAIMAKLQEVSKFEQVLILGWSQRSGYKILVAGTTAENCADARRCAEKLTCRLRLPGKIEI